MHYLKNMTTYSRNSEEAGKIREGIWVQEGIFLISWY